MRHRLPGQLRSCRANIAAFNFLQQLGAFTRDSAGGKYRVAFSKFQAGVDLLSNRILTIQGNGDYDALGKFQDQYGKISPELQRDLDRLKAKKIRWTSCLNSDRAIER